VMDGSRKLKKPHRWKGELAKPLLVKVLEIPFDPDQTKACLQRANALEEGAVREARIEKLALLMEHYRIADKTDYLGLALALAVDLVPGFRVGSVHQLFRLEHAEERVRGADGAEHILPAYGKVLGPKRGRQREWTPERLDSLLKAVEQTKQHNGVQTDREALVVLARRMEWSRPAESGQREWIKTLMNQLAIARKNEREATRFEETFPEIIGD
jgi:hypothetical protein